MGYVTLDLCTFLPLLLETVETRTLLALAPNLTGTGLLSSVEETCLLTGLTGLTVFTGSRFTGLTGFTGLIGSCFAVLTGLTGFVAGLSPPVLGVASDFCLLSMALTVAADSLPLPGWDTLRVTLWRSHRIFRSLRVPMYTLP